MQGAHKEAGRVIAMKQMDESILPDFYGQKLDSKNQVKFFILVSSLGEWLEKVGFRIHKEQLVKVEDNIVSSVEEKEMYQLALAYVKTFNDDVLTSDFMIKGASLLLNQKGTILGLSKLSDNFLRSTKDLAYFFYSNGVVCVSKDAFNIIPYAETKGLIWKEKIINREFNTSSDSEFTKCIYGRFLKNITDNKEHYRSLTTAMGYLMHRYKSPTNVKAVILNDKSIAIDGSPEGGTGKGLNIKAIGKLVNVTTLNGKNLNLKTDKFALQNVTLQTDLIYIDDADKHLDFEQFFSSLSENTEIERKHKDKLQLPFKDSPKIAMTTNYALKGVSSSHLRRKQDVFINGYYSHLHSPYDDFGCEFFHEWDSLEWQHFDNLMLSFVQDYLNSGLVEYSTRELKEKMLRNQTNEEFWEAMETRFNAVNVKHSKGELKSYMSELNPSLSGISQKKINTYIDMYADFKGLISEHITGAGNFRHFRFKEKADGEVDTELDFIQDGEEMIDF
ncbi:MAG: primase-helicase family protein [Maribacter dokdonensis]|uniref:primase-helicase family protein n=2 Tax=Maribacter dokdonensis TaxID=320912 RepID=UPI003299CCCB